MTRNHFQFDANVCIKGIGFQLIAQAQNHILAVDTLSLQLIVIEQYSLAVLLLGDCFMILFCFGLTQG